MTLRTLLCLVALGVVTTAQGAERKPNVLIIMIDDLGWMDLRCQGNGRLDTPNLDRLARQGVRFTDAYAAAPVCSPVRAAIMTGQAPARLKLTNHLPHQPRFTPEDAKLDPAPMVDHLSPDYVTLAERMKGAGYTTAFMGKWHLTPGIKRQGEGRLEHYPERQGFDINIGGCSLGGPPTFWDPYRIHNIPPRKTGEYLPDRLADEASSFIARQGDKPWFLCLWNYTVHWPMEAPADLVAKYEKRKGLGVRDARYAAMIEAMDASIGRVLKSLDNANVADDTLVVFTSDNGAYKDVADNRPLRLGKGYLYEGGIRVPMIVRWPGVTKPSELCTAPVISTDLFPTALEAAGLKNDPSTPCDGESLVGVLRGDRALEREALFWHYPNYAWHGSNRLGAAVRAGRFKLIKHFDDNSVELYDLATDIGEEADLSSKRPDLAMKLRESLDAWLKDVSAEMPKAR